MLHKAEWSNVIAIRYNGGLLLTDIEVESSTRKHPVKQRF